MDHLKRFRQEVSNVAFVSVFVPGILSLLVYIMLREVAGMQLWLACGIVALLYLGLVTLAYSNLIKLFYTPISTMWQAILHVSPINRNVQAPKLDSLVFGRELIGSLVMQVYDLAGAKPGDKQDGKGMNPADASSLPEALPLPLFMLNKDRVITTTNQAACTYLKLTRDKIINRSVYDVLHLSFSNDDTFDGWLETIAEKRATDSKSWEHVRLTLEDTNTVRQFDLAASYSQDSSSGNEVALLLFDKSSNYGNADNSTSYIAMAVHELRTPLTVLRGYIEVFEDELGDQLTPELKEFMRKMNASAQTLTAFVSNILNVARVDESQMALSLHEADWGKVITDIMKDLELRASVRGKTIELEIEPELPTAAIDKISMYEVVSNLVDNAIKYSGQSKRILVKVTKSNEGTIDTTVQDFGVGIPDSAIKDLFTKYYRSHRSKNAVSGSGLGLYLVKSIVTAHGGTVWVNTKPDEGSTFGFSLQTFATASQDAKRGHDGIERHASGWIRNHSLYRR